MDLRSHIARKSAALSDRVQHVDGEGSAADRDHFQRELEELERLARLLKIQEEAAPPAPRKRWPLVAAFVATLGVISVLLFGRVSRTEIELDVGLTEVGFRLSEERALFGDATVLSELVVAGLREVRLPATREQRARVLPVPSVRLNASADAGPPGAITLDLVLPEGTVVQLSEAESDLRYRLAIRGPLRPLEASLVDGVQITPHRAAPEAFAFAAPGVVVLSPARAAVQFDLTYAAAAAAFAPQLAVDSLSLARVVKAYDPAIPSTRLVSNVVGGTLYLEALDGEPYPLRPGEHLQVRELTGVVRSLRLTDDHIALQLHGFVGGLSSGVGENRRDLMPTYLEWLSNRQGLLLLWGAVLYVFGVAVGLLRWWGVSL